VAQPKQDTPKAGQAAKPRTAWWQEAVKEPLRSVGALVAGGDARTKRPIGSVWVRRTGRRAREDARGGSAKLARSPHKAMTPALKDGTLVLLHLTVSRGPPCSYLT